MIFAERSLVRFTCDYKHLYEMEYEHTLTQEQKDMFEYIPEEEV